MVLDHCLYVVKGWIDSCSVHAHDVGAFSLHLCHFASAPFNPNFYWHRGTGGRLYVPNARDIFLKECAVKTIDIFYFIDIH
jgi:hypothetical protein